MSSPEFHEAVMASKQLTKKPDNNELLQLYAYYKQATQDPPIDSAPQPGTFDLKGKAKRKAWQKLVDAGVEPSAAERSYIQLVNEFKDKYDYDPNKKPEEVGGKE